jgi:6-phosphogluconolactonase
MRRSRELPDAAWQRCRCNLLSSNAEIRILNTSEELFSAAAEEFAALADSAVQTSGRFIVALSGGSTPKGLYSLLASGAYARVPWDRVHFFFSDERNVPPDDAESNYRLANQALLSKINAKHVYRVPTELNDAEAAAKSYEQTLVEAFQIAPGEFPRFDLLLLGMGPDGHTASLFPGSKALQEKRRLVVANWVEQFKTTRITFTFPVLNQAACVTFLVSGAEKAQAVRQIFKEGQDLPSGRVQPVEGRLVWMMDTSASAALSMPDRSVRLT